MSLKPLWDKIKPWSRWLIVLVLFLFIALGSYSLGSKSADDRITAMLSENQGLHTEITTTRNRVVTADRAIKQLSDEKTQLIELVAELQRRADKPPIIREVVRVQTVVEPAEPVYVVQELPPEYRFTLEPGLEVARFSTDGKDYKFTTHQLEIRNSVVIGERKSTALLQVASSADPETFYEIPIDDLQVRTTDPDLKLFRPDVHLTVRAGLSQGPQLTVSLGLTLLHPTKCVDTVGLNVSGNTSTAQVGIIPFAYNLGCHLPVVNDLWIVTDGYMSFNPRPEQPLGIGYGAGLGIGTKF